MDNTKSKLGRLTITAEQLFFVSAVISPLFLLTVSGWMTRIVVVCALFGAYVLYKNRNATTLDLDGGKVQFYKILLCLSLALPIFGILLGQMFRGQFSLPYYDSPAHILICTLVLLAATKTGPKLIKWMSYAFPIATLLALVDITLDPNLFWGAARLTTKPLDPLNFGSLSLTFALLSLISIKLHDNASKWLLIYKLIGFSTGIYLSILSGSRTGWLAVPIILAFWLYHDHAKFTWKTKSIATISIFAIIFSSYFLSSNIHQRVNETTKDLASYQWHTSQPNDYNSLGARISFIRMAVYLFELKPLGGWGDGGYEAVINDPALNFSLPETKDMALRTGFHNDITANMVRSGIWGLMATLALFLIPAIFFMRNLRSENKNQRDVAFLALAFISCQFMSSLSMEIFNLRYSASFYGLMIALFSGQIIFYMTQQPAAINGEKK
jgi:O-antigen ligase